MLRHIISNTELPLRYNDDELKKVVMDCIKDCAIHFDSRTLLGLVRYRAEIDNQFLKEPNTDYSTISLTKDDCTRISKVLWDLIFERKIIVELFHERPTESPFHFTKI